MNIPHTDTCFLLDLPEPSLASLPEFRCIGCSKSYQDKIHWKKHLEEFHYPQWVYICSSCGDSATHVEVGNGIYAIEGDRPVSEGRSLQEQAMALSRESSKAVTIGAFTCQQEYLTHLHVVHENKVVPRVARELAGRVKVMACGFCDHEAFTDFDVFADHVFAHLLICTRYAES